jgi:putative endonuclease
MFSALRKLITTRDRPPRAPHIQLGERGERAALNYLKQFENYEIVATNFHVPLGRGLRGQKLTGEIDIIAYDEDVLAFVEVKTRTSDDLFAPEQAVNLKKQRQIARAARRYRHLMSIEGPYRYDVVTVIPDGKRYTIELLRAYFDDDVFRRGRWFGS